MKCVAGIGITMATIFNGILLKSLFEIRPHRVDSKVIFC